MFSVKTQHSDPYIATGLTRALYNFILVFLDISLLWSIFWLIAVFRKLYLLFIAVSFNDSGVRSLLLAITPKRVAVKQ
jgi:TM2 domain-containing membrane protein YozV